MIAVAIFLGDPALIAEVRTLYGNLKESDVYTHRSAVTLLRRCAPSSTGS